MSTAMIERPVDQPEQKTILITTNRDLIRSQISSFMELTIKGVDDAEGREAVSTARKLCQKLRTTAEKDFATIKETALRECQRIDKDKREVLAIIEPYETHLKGLEAGVKAIEDKIEQDRINTIRLARQVSLTNIGFDPTDFREIDFGNLGEWSDDQFNSFLLKAAGMVSAKRQRDAEAAQLKADREKLERERLAQQELLNQQQADIDRQQAELRTQQQAAEKIERDRKQREADQQLEAERLKKLEALKPDHEKLLSVLDGLSQIEIPEVSETGEYAKLQIVASLQAAYDQITTTLKGMVK